MSDDMVTITVESSVIYDAITALDYMSKRPSHDIDDAIDLAYWFENHQKLQAAFEKAAGSDEANRFRSPIGH